MSGTWKTLGDLIILEIWNYRDMKFSKNSLVFFPIFWIEGNKVDILYKNYIYWIPWSVIGMIGLQKEQLPKHSAVYAYT